MIHAFAATLHERAGMASGAFCDLGGSPNIVQSCGLLTRLGEIVLRPHSCAVTQK